MRALRLSRIGGRHQTGFLRRHPWQSLRSAERDGGQIQTAANGDQFWMYLLGQFCQTVHINRVSIRQYGGVMDVQPE